MRLTDLELEHLVHAARPNSITAVMAAVEIRELREKVVLLQRATLYTSSRLLEDDNLQLREKIARLEAAQTRSPHMRSSPHHQVGV